MMEKFLINYLELSCRAFKSYLSPAFHRLTISVFCFNSRRLLLLLLTVGRDCSNGSRTEEMFLMKCLALNGNN